MSDEADDYQDQLQEAADDRRFFSKKPTTATKARPTAWENNARNLRIATVSGRAVIAAAQSLDCDPLELAKALADGMAIAELVRAAHEAPYSRQGFAALAEARLLGRKG